MKSQPKLYKTLFGFFKCSPWLDKRHWITFIWMVYGIIQVRKIHPSEWVPFVQSRANQAQSTERRFTRWIHNDRIDVASIYDPLIREILTNWEDPTLYLAFDTCMLWNSFCQQRLCVIYRGRSIPLVWETIKHGSSMVSLHHYKHLLQRAKALLPKGVKIIFLADRGFADTQLMDYLSNVLHWNWRIRYKKSFHLYRQNKRKTKLSRLNVSAQYGHANFYHNVYLTEEKFGPVHVAFARLSGKRETWLIVSDEPTDQDTLKEYGLRYDIEEGFKDDKSGAFQLEASGFREASALTRLYLVIAVATLFLVSQGVDVVEKGLRSRVDPHWKRGLSYLKIGLRWVLAASTKGYQLIKKMVLPSASDPEPVSPSKRYRPPNSIVDEFEISCQVFDV